MACCSRGKVRCGLTGKALLSKGSRCRFESCRRGVKRTKNVVLGFTLALAATVMAGCEEEPPEDTPDYSRICVAEDMTRLEDDDCEDGQSSSGGRASWFWYLRQHKGPAVGTKATPAHGVRTAPTSGTVGTIPAKGGFGTSTGGGG